MLQKPSVITKLEENDLIGKTLMRRVREASWRVIREPLKGLF